MPGPGAPSRAGMNQPGQTVRPGRGHDDVLERQADRRRVDRWRPWPRETCSAAIDDREAIGERERESRRSRLRSRPCGVVARVKCRARGADCQAWRPVSTTPIPAIHSGRGKARAPCRPRRRADGAGSPDQGGVAQAGAPAPPGPDRRRPRGVAGRDATHGRDQRGLASMSARPGYAAATAHPARRPRPVAHPGPLRLRAAAVHRSHGRRGRSPVDSTSRARSGRAMPRCARLLAVQAPPRATPTRPPPDPC